MSIRRTAVYIDLKALEQNFENISERIQPSVRRCLVIKTNGYGHGAVPIAKRLADRADFLAVATAEEAFALREEGIALPILILGYTWEEDYEELIRREIRPAVFSEEDAGKIAAAAARVGKTAKIHIKVDTGMSRIGFVPGEDAAEAVRRIRRMDGIEVEGIFTHFARADETDKTSANAQAELFRAFIREVERGEKPIPIHHCANSAAAMEMPEMWMDMVRIGISLYGIYPSDEVDHDTIALKQVMTWKSEVVLVKEIPAGQGVSYGHTYVAESPRRIATIPVGYGDGYPRMLSGRGYVMIRGQRAPILGRVCMDQMMVDVTGIPGVCRGDEVLLTGTGERGILPVEELSALSGRFPYEFVCDVSERVPRIYI